MQIAELEAGRRRLRDDRAAGLYDAPDDAEWFRETYARMGAELEALRTLSERPAGLRWVETGETLADQWAVADGDVLRQREILATYGVSVLLWPRGHAQRVYIHHARPQVITDVLDMIERARAETPEDARMRREREQLGWRLLGPKRMIELEKQAGARATRSTWSSSSRPLMRKVSGRRSTPSNRRTPVSHLIRPRVGRMIHNRPAHQPAVFDLGRRRRRLHRPPPQPMTPLRDSTIMPHGTQHTATDRRLAHRESALLQFASTC